jgi:hypothetical protein
MKKATLALLLGSLSAGTSHAELVSNGDFETGDFSGWTQSGDVDPLYTNVDPFFASTLGGGNYGAVLGPYNGAVGGLSQTLATVQGQEYQVQFDLANFDPNHVNHFEASFSGEPLVGGATPSLPITNGNAFDWTLYTFDVTAQSASSQLAFTFSSKDAYFGLDNVSVVAVPIPAAVWLFGSALVGLGLNRRGKRT